MGWSTGPLLKRGFSRGPGAWGSQRVGMRQLSQVLALQDTAMNVPVTRHTLASEIPLFLASSLFLH